MIEKAMVERFEGSLAVLRVGEKARRVNLPRQLLPRGAKEGTRLRVEFDGSEIVKVEIEGEEKKKRR